MKSEHLAPAKDFAEDNAEYAVDTDELKAAIATTQEAVEALIAGTGSVQAGAAQGHCKAVKLAWSQTPAKANMKPGPFARAENLAVDNAEYAADTAATTADTGTLSEAEIICM